MSRKITIWGQPNCTYCDAAKKLLNQLNIDYEYRELVTMDDKAEFFEVTNGARTVPQIIVNDKLIGGYQELRKYLSDSI